MPTNPLITLIIELLILLISLAAAGLLSIRRTGQFRASRLMLWLMVAFAAVALNAIVNTLWLDNSTAYFNLLLGLVAPPLLLLYVRSMLGDRLSRGRDGYHFFTFFLVSAISLIPGQLQLLQESWWVIFPNLYIAVYLVVIYTYIGDRMVSMVQIRSRLPLGKLRLLHLCLLIWLLATLSDGLGEGLQRFGVAEHATASVLLVARGMKLLLVLGLVSVVLTKERPVETADLQEEAFLNLIADREAPEPEDIRSNASLFKTLDATMQSEKYFFDDDLRLNQLATLMGKTPREISRAVHHVGGQSFFNYVNGYRALAAQVMIDNNEKRLPLEEIQYTCGIESRLVFNRSFKRLTGSSPSAYYKLNTTST
jgi:AraC-like DNA-binding protein